MTKGSKLALKILEFLKPKAQDTSSLLGTMLSSYHASYRKARNRLNGGYIVSDPGWREAELQSFYSLLNKLKRENLIKKQKSELGKTLWKLTSLGIKKLQVFQAHKQKNNKAYYEVRTGDKVKIVVFDIPESNKHHRAWLRDVLKILGFKILQKSVWIGKAQIPEALMLDLRKKQLLKCVHILEVSKTGTLREFY